MHALNGVKGNHKRHSGGNFLHAAINFTFAKRGCLYNSRYKQVLLKAFGGIFIIHFAKPVLNISLFNSSYWKRTGE